MRLQRVEVTGLFGLFDHVVELQEAERITILFGTNGIGKTVVLRMIAALLGGSFAIFRQIPFGTFTLSFSDGSSLSVIRTVTAEGEDGGQTRISLEVEHRTSNGEVRREGTAIKGGAGRLRALGDRIDRYVPYERTGPTTWRDHVGRRVGLEEVVGRFRPMIDPSLLENIPPSPPPFVKELREHFPPVRLIETQRLQKGEHHAEHWQHKEEALSTVQDYSRHLAREISKALQLYAARAQDLDRTFPSRLMTSAPDQGTTPEELRQKLAELDAKRAQLVTMGFLDKEQDLAQPTNEALAARRDVLAIYTSDVEAKLKTFDQLAERIDLFMRIINSRFDYKMMSIDRAKGFVFTQSTGANLSPDDLSSGEQHELVLFYDLLFKLEPHSLVLIDEPELSLHVTWQQEFLEDLGQVATLSDVDVIVATHAPEIIGKKWPLVVRMTPKLSSDGQLTTTDGE